MDIVFPIVLLAIIAAILVVLVAGWFILKRLAKSKKTFRWLYAALCMAMAYGVYFVTSMFFSAIDTGYGYDVGMENIAAIKGGLDLKQVFAQEGAVFEDVGLDWSAKQCHLYFLVKEGSPITIPQALDSYISAHPELGSGNSLHITVRIIGRNAPSCEKVYFWWRMLY